MSRTLTRQPRRKPDASLLARVSFTGQLASLTRKEARDLVHAAGGQTVSAVSRRTTMLVVGMDGWPLLPSGEIAGKLQKAEELNAAGASIRIASEQQFLEAVGLRGRQPELRKTYSADQICALINIDRTTLARWEALGLVRGSDAGFDFQDIVSLRTIAELVHAGVKPDVIGRSIRRLASILPQTDRPLAQLKLVSEQGGLLAEIEGALVSPDGQILLNFDEGLKPPGHQPSKPWPTSDEQTPEHPGRSAAISAPAAQTREASAPRCLDALGGSEQLVSADDWFERGCELEEARDYPAALAAYRRAVMLQHLFPQAHFNIANVLLALQRPDAAEERFRIALEQDRNLPAAWYNLADVLESSGRVHEAIAALKRALQIAPLYADAHFNLASCYEQVGQLANAAHHWEQYLKLDSTSEWAKVAQQRLRAL